MIMNVSNSMVSKSAPSFGFARINDVGVESARAFGYEQNGFLDADMFKRQGLFKESTISQKLRNGDNFENLCSLYGCSKNPKANAEFIKTQVLNVKSANSIKAQVPENEYNNGLRKLYHSNYDNPELSVGSTKQLLEMVKYTMAPEEYVKNAGILEAGTKK